MKYLAYIVLIVLTLSLFSILLGNHYQQDLQTEKIALTVNDREITQREFDRQYSQAQNNQPDRESFIKSVITREVLLQHAQQLGMDKEESFRLSLQNYYEQTLIKELIERKIATLAIDVTAEEIDRFSSLMNTTIHLFPTNKGNGADGEAAQIIESFSDLSAQVQILIMDHAPGDEILIDTGSKNLTPYRIQKILKDETAGQSSLSRQDFTEIILKYKKEQAINGWIADLEKNAQVHIQMNSNP
ncbi:SurA N-terminal domain-containing protein [Thermodesulfobacteriota bacterium]